MLINALAIGATLVIASPITGHGVDMSTTTDNGRNDRFITAVVNMGYQPCAREDSIGPCYWDAATRGNGKGVSFVVTDSGEMFYADGIRRY